MATDAAISVTEDFFRLTVPRITDLSELKLVLQLLYLTERRGGPVPESVLLSAQIPGSVVGLDSPEPAEVRMRRVIERAVANGTLIRLTTAGAVAFLPGTERFRRQVDQARDGEPAMPGRAGIADADDVAVYRPNAFALYEQNIGPLTPLIAERIRDAERTYPRTWIERAIEETVGYNKRNWRYVEAILARWEEIGGPDEASGRRS
ncbi:MAG TPA: DnaD domain protein [Chloroflexota bacterium]|nr:DnaD domain protein [Chloroflexota bacterium]